MTYTLSRYYILRHQLCKIYTVCTRSGRPQNPETAVALCKEQGLSREALEDMDYRDAQALYERTVPDQKELW
jgi:hypothetical protein